MYQHSAELALLFVGGLGFVVGHGCSALVQFGQEGQYSSRRL
jgi:hypothetical protein